MANGKPRYIYLRHEMGIGMNPMKPKRSPERYVYNPVKPFNERIRELIKSTHPSGGPIAVSPMGKRFKVRMDSAYWKDYYALTGTDGIGTKGLLHWRMNTMRYGAQDAFAMVVDDLIEGGYAPVTLQDHILMQEESQERIFAIIKALVELSKKNKWKAAGGKSYPIIISGGETAIINTLQGFEIGITATGYAKKGEEIRAEVKSGDLIIGLGSSGVHTNGLSFFREEFFSRRKMQLGSRLPWGATVGEELTVPTNVYLPAIKALMERLKGNQSIHGMVHITGGGISKLKELLNGNVDIAVRRDHRLEPQEIFRYAHDEFGLSSDKMYSRFNNGVGYVVAVEESCADRALGALKRHFPADVIGEVRKGSGKIAIESQYDRTTVRY